MYSSFLRISSAERINTSDPVSNFRVSINNDSILQKINMIAVKEVTIPNTQYNIRSTNNILNLYYEGDHLFTIPQGQYTINSLITTLNNIQSSVTFIQDPLTLKIGVKNNGYDYVLANTTNSIIKTLGGENLYNVFLSFTVYTYFSNLPDLTGARNFYVSSSVLSDGNSMISPTLPKMPIIAVVPNNTNWGQITYYQSNEQKLDEIYYPSQSQGKNLTNIDLQLRNLDGSFVELNLDWSILIKVHYN